MKNTIDDKFGNATQDVPQTQRHPETGEVVNEIIKTEKKNTDADEKPHTTQQGIKET